MADELLARLLAAIDAMFIPQRDPFAPRWPIVWQRRRRYSANGVPFHPGAGMGESDRKAAGRTMAKLSRDGLVERHGSGRAAGWAITPVGADVARAKVGLPWMNLSLGVLQIVADRQALTTRWVPEPEICGVKWGDNENRHELVTLEEMLLPSLVAGLATSNSTIHGHVAYTLTDQGRAVLAGELEAEGLEEVQLPSVVPALRQLYYAEIKREWENLDAIGRAPARERDLGEIPLSVAELARP